MPAKVSQQVDDAAEVGQLLNDIRDTLLPTINPDCTFTSRRQDKRLQERLIDLSEQCDGDFTSLVYSADQEARGWGDVKPYAKYVERPRPGKPDQGNKRRNTLPVDSSTIVRHLQERIQKWASRKSDRSYSTRTYRAVRPGEMDNKKDTIKVPLINSVDLSSSSSKEEGKEKLGKKSDKLDVNWNILSNNDAALLNMSTYGVDPSCTYVPARKAGSSSAPMNNYTASKQFISENKQKKSRGVLHPRRSQMVKRLPKCKEVTIDLPEDPEETKLMMTPATRKVAPPPKKKSFKCSICIEGLQVADWPTDFEYYPKHDQRSPAPSAPSPYKRPPDPCPVHGHSPQGPDPCPLHSNDARAVEKEVLYIRGGSRRRTQATIAKRSTSEPRVPKITPFVGRNATAVSESLQDYKRLKSREGTEVQSDEPASEPFPIVPESTKVTYTIPTSVPPPDKEQQAKSSFQKLNTKIIVKSDRSVKRSGDRPRRGKHGLHTGPTGTSPRKAITKTQQLKADHTSIMLNGTCTLETSSKIMKRLSDCDRDESPPKSPLSLFDRFQASRSRDGARAAAEKHPPKISVKLNKKGHDKRERQMLGVSICDIFTSPGTAEEQAGVVPELLAAPHDPGLGDVYEILFDSGEPDLSKPKLDPIMNIRPLYIN